MISAGRGMAEMLHIGGGFLTALESYVQAVADTAPEAQEAATQTLVGDLQQRAQQHPRWEPIAHEIEAWEDSRGLRVGVRRSVAAARQAEYGDQEHGPVPLLRHMPGSAKLAGEAMGDVFRTSLGIPTP